MVLFTTDCYASVRLPVSTTLTPTFYRSRCPLQQQHVDCNCKIAESLLKKGNKQHVGGWNTTSKAWVHMVLHLPYVEGVFAVTFNDITRIKMVLSIQILHVLWFGLVLFKRTTRSSQNDLADSSSWSPSQSHGTRGGRNSQDGFSHQQESGLLFLP